jgi:PTS system mannose-specific IID component
MALMMNSAAEDLYPGDHDKQVDLVKRHEVFFNTQQGIGSIVWGIALGMEIEKARNDEVPNDMIQTIKTALAGPLAGFGDTVWQVLFVPILLSISIGLSADGSVLGAVFAVVVYVLVNLFLTRFLFTTGVKLGVDGADMLISSGIKDRLIGAIEAMGIIVVGAVVGNNVNIQTALNLGFNGTNVAVQTDVFDAIYPGIFTLVGVAITYYFLAKKKVTPIRMMLGMLVVAIIGYFTTILA